MGLFNTIRPSRSTKVVSLVKKGKFYLIQKAINAERSGTLTNSNQNKSDAVRVIRLGSYSDVNEAE
jgi:hypothetical protein